MNAMNATRREKEQIKLRKFDFICVYWNRKTNNNLLVVTASRLDFFAVLYH